MCTALVQAALASLQKPPVCQPTWCKWATYAACLNWLVRTNYISYTAQVPEFPYSQNSLWTRVAGFEEEKLNKIYVMDYYTACRSRSKITDLAT